MKRLFCLVLVLILLCFSAQGCGKKADPRCPSVAPIGRVSDLGVEGRGEGLRLTWNLSGDVKSADRVRIYRSGLNRSLEDCPGCPRTFVLIGEVDPGDARFLRGGEGRYAYFDSTVEKGYRYAYRVSICTAAGQCADATDSAEIDF